MNLPTENQTTIGGVAVLGAMGLYLAAPRIINSIGYALDKYDKNSLSRIKAIQRAYHDFLSKEQKTPYSTLERITPTPELPLFFLMGTKEGEKKELPRMYLEGHSIITDATTWEDHIGLTYLSADINDLISYICQYQLNRSDYIEHSNQSGKKIYKAISEAVLGDAQFCYDPINLFCEELKVWLANLAVANIDENSKNFISARINYLNAISSNSIFHQRNTHQTAFIGFIAEVINRLEVSILYCVKLVLSRKSAREYFSELYLSNKKLLRNLIRFLFYVYNDAEVIPQTFSIREISQPTLPAYKVALNTISGELLRLLVNTASFSQAYDLNLPCHSQNIGKYNFLKIKIESTEKELVSADSIHTQIKSYTPVFPKICTANLIYIYNWFKVEDEQITVSSKESFMKKSGIIKECRNSELMEEFLLLHGYIEKLSFFCIIINSLYDLAGEAGNLLLFGYASQVILSVLNNAKDFFHTLETCVRRLYEKAHELYLKFENHEAEACNPGWSSKNYPHLNKTFGYLIDNMQTCLKKIVDITSLMEAINHPDYAETVKEKILYLLKYIDSFNDTKINTVTKVPQRTKVERKKTLPSGPFFQVASDNCRAIMGTPLFELAKADYKQGIQHCNTKNYPKAFSSFRRVIKVLEKNNVKSNLLFKSYSYCASILLNNPIVELHSKSSVHYFDKAIALWDQSDGLKTYFTLHFRLAEAYEGKRMFTAAKETLEKILEKAKDDKDYQEDFKTALVRKQSILLKQSAHIESEYLLAQECSTNTPRGKLNG